MLLLFGRWISKNIKLHKWKNIENIEHNFKNSIGENPFIDLSRFVLRILSLPYSNDEVERTFSLMNLFKSKIRNRLSLNSTFALLHIKYGLKFKNACSSNFKLPSNVCNKINSNETYKRSKFFIKTVLWPNECDDEFDFFEDETIV